MPCPRAPWPVALAAVVALASCEAVPTWPKLSLTDSGWPSPFGVAKGELGQLHTADEAEQWQSWQAIRSAYDDLRALPDGDFPVAAGPTTGGYLELDDRDGDRGVDFFTYRDSPEDVATDDFGAIFDLDANGRPDWIVFHGGVFTFRDGSLREWTHHAIDRDGDGAADVYGTDLVDLDRDGAADPGLTAWFYDDDGDGRIDRAAHATAQGPTSMRISSGYFASGLVLWPVQGEWPGPGAQMPTEPLDRIAEDATTLLLGLMARTGASGEGVVSRAGFEPATH